MRINNIDYISLTDLARYKNSENPGDVVIKWMSNKNFFDFYCLWEELFNENFKLAQSREFKNDSANQSFTMSPSRWITMTNAKDLSVREVNMVVELLLILISPLNLHLGLIQLLNYT